MRLVLKKISCPIGVIGVIFEARPDVISQISSLAIKSGNALILKGGSEAKNTNKIIFEIINNTLNNIKEFPKYAVNQIFTREDVAKMLELDKYIDLIIPRGGNTLVKYIKENTKIPVLGHADGICHIFIDESADKTQAEAICVDAKTQYPSACNSVETILIHKNYSYKKELIDTLKENDVKIIGDEICTSIVSDIEKATENDWSTEYGDKTVSIKIVSSINDAIEHGGNVLVHCYAGISRSTSIVIAYLMKNKKMSFNKALELIKEKRGKIQPNSGFVLQLKAYEKELGY